MNLLDASALLTIPTHTTRWASMARSTDDTAANDADEADLYDRPIDVLRPERQTSPFVFASPHSGRVYHRRFQSASRLDPTTLRASEDAFVDELFETAPDRGAPLLRARFPRAYIDANRHAWEIDPAMFDGPVPAWINARTPRVAAGLGSIPRIVADGAEIYAGPIRFEEAERRIRALHEPYHDALNTLLMESRARFGCAILLDCHSMPSIGGPGDRDRGRNRVDVVLGDRYGSSCAPQIVNDIEMHLRGLGLRVARNTPYAGGYSTERYGRPSRGFHAVQIEINRGLYMDERRVSKSRGFKGLKADMAEFIARLSASSARQAAE